MMDERNQDALFDYPIFSESIYEIGLKVHEQFIEKIYDNLEESNLISIFNHLESYWFDSLRSSIIWLCNDIVGGVPEKTINLSLIISIIGSGLGVHDDIIDQTQMKGHRKTILELFGPERALVAGDFLIMKGLTSMDLLLDEFGNNIFISLIDVFKDYYQEMAVAEMLEISSNKQIDLELDQYLDMLWKLGVDIKTCAKLGAISGNANVEQIKALSYFGSSIGYINRLIEEINDVFHIEGNLRTRIKNESCPLALIYATKQSEYNYKIINEIIYKKEFDEKDMQQILHICYEVDAMNYIKEEIFVVYYNAIKRLEIFPKSYARKMLTWCLYYIVNKNDILN